MTNLKKMFNASFTEERTEQIVKTLTPYALKKLSVCAMQKEGCHIYLFSGTNGTGKILAAELLGKAFQGKIRNIMSKDFMKKYIGETEKNLARLFNEAASSNAILFFDEADVLFGKRTVIKDAHDKYANQEVSYMLKRLEDAPIIIFLNVNNKSSIHPSIIQKANVFIIH